MLSTLSSSYRLHGTGNEKSWDPQQSLEEFYYSIPKEYRLTMPYEYRDDFKTRSPPDYNDQFIFFMLAFFDSSIEKKEDEQIDLGLSALSALLHINHASWINSEEIIHIRKKLLDIFTTKTYNEVQELFDNFSQDKEKQNSLKITLRVIYLVKNHTNKIDN